MKKTTLVLAVSCLIGHSASSQLLSTPVPVELIIANGGTFEFTQPYQDHATIGRYDVNSGAYTVFDTIKVESVADVACTHGGDFGPFNIYVAAQDTLVAYDLNYDRINSVFFESLRSVSAFQDDDMVVAGTWFGSINAVTVYDMQLTPSFSISTTDLPYAIYDAQLVGDSLYVSYNFPSVVDNCPPYGCYGDSLGMLGVIHVPTQSYVRSINLGTDAAGIRELSAQGSTILASCTGSGNIMEYEAVSGASSAVNESVATSLNELPTSEGLAYISGSDVKKYNGTSAAITGITNVFPVVGFYDDVFSSYYYTDTDYATYGTLYVKNSSDNHIDTVAIDISPEAITMHYDMVGSTNDITHQSFDIYPNPATDNIRISVKDFEQMSIYNVGGSLVKSYNKTSIVYDVSDLTPGVYSIHILSNNTSYVQKLIIR